MAELCKYCGAALKEGARFCKRCGNAVVIQQAAAVPQQAAAVPQQAAGNVCPACGAALKPGARFCKRCGTSMAAAPAPVQAQPVQQAAPVLAAQPQQKAAVVPQQAAAVPQQAAAVPQQAAANVCPACGAALKPGARFCKRCGISMTAPAPAPVQARPQNVAQTVQQTATQAAGIVSQLAGGTLNASSMRGETVLGSTGGGAIKGMLGGASSAIQYINPFKMLISGAANIFKSLSAAIKNKKYGGIFIALILAVVWVLLTLLPALGINSASIQFLSWLTFAQGGLSGGIGGVAGYATGLLGGMLGKGIVAGFITSIVMSLINKQNPFKSIGGGFGRLFSGQNTKQPGSIGPTLIGVGIALIGYNFMAGTASLTGTMAGIAALLITVKALGSRAGFLRNLLGGLLAKNKQIDASAVNACMAGMAGGFALSLPMSAIPWAYTPYTAGAILLVAGLILFIASGGKKEVTAS